ncbi:MAG: hypothetical protein IJJ68_08975 [Prevotella sp.]|nr:hypothetical protein [Prevotella sp.]
MMELEIYNVKYNGREYPVAEIPDVFTHEADCYLLIGSHSLNLALFHDEKGYPDEKARIIDEKIYAFIDDCFFNLNKKDFIAKVKKLLD